MLEAFVDAPLRHESLTVFPVIAPHGPVLPYLLSTEVRDSGVLSIRERGDAPNPVLLVRNNSLHPLLILAGEPLPRENQGRLVERSILLAGKSVTQIPASPVERGDWISSSQEPLITEWLEHFPETRRQVGFLVFQGRQMIGLEALGSPNLYGPLHRRLLVRFIKKALRYSPTEGGDPTELEAEANRIVGAIAEADRIPRNRVGVGSYCSLTGPVRGGDLTHQGHLVHLTVTSVDREWTSNTSNQRGVPCS
ncbi:MAG: hypothetical protein PVJ76_11505 [Gemmatimonadota bacterium]|jgi:hypothetical protein